MYVTVIDADNEGGVTTTCDPDSAPCVFDELRAGPGLTVEMSAPDCEAITLVVELVDSPKKRPFAFTGRNADNRCSVNYTHLHGQTSHTQVNVITASANAIRPKLPGLRIRARMAICARFRAARPATDRVVQRGLLLEAHPGQEKRYAFASP